MSLARTSAQDVSSLGSLTQCAQACAGIWAVQYTQRVHTSRTICSGVPQGVNSGQAQAMQSAPACCCPAAMWDILLCLHVHSLCARMTVPDVIRHARAHYLHVLFVSACCGVQTRSSASLARVSIAGAAGLVVQSGHSAQSD
jgi:hypothetical protein